MPFGASRSDWPAHALLTLLCLALYLPGLTTIPPVDRDEARFAQATKQMLESGDFIRPHFLTENRFKKPIGIYWLQSASVLLTGQRGRPAIWAYRLPSLVGALAAVLLTYRLGRRLFHPQAALLGAALLAASVLLVVEAHLATTDAVQLACVVAAQGCLGALYAAARRGARGPARYAAGFWMAQGAGILVKGPIVPLVSGLTLATLVACDGWSSARASEMRRLWLSGLRSAWGVPLMLVIVLPWAVAVGWATDWTFYRDWIGGDLVPKIVGGHESHGAPPGFYLLLLAVTFWPGSLAVGLGAVRAVRRRARCGERFCLAWLIPTWMFFEVMPTKLPHYVLPVYPALGLLVARAALAVQARHVSALHSRVMRSGLVLWGVLTLAMGILPVAGAAIVGSGADRASGLVVAVAAGIAVIGVCLCWSGQPLRASWVAVGGSIALFAPTLQWVIPELHALWLSPAASAAVAQQGAGGDGPRPLAAVGYQEPSLAFLVGTDVTFVDATGAATFLKERRDALVLVSDDQRAAFTEAAHGRGLRPREVWSMDGVNYSKGRRVRLRLFDEPSQPLE